MREMDCMDCHNRPSHSYDLPERALDKAMANGLISAALPFRPRSRPRTFSRWITRPATRRPQKIPAAFEQFYQDSYPAVWSQRQAEVTASAKAVLAIWDRNIFPDMNVTWGKYPMNIGHTDFPGCFRCHDGGHTAKNGNAITQDCSACHNILAMDEANPKVLTDLGVTEPKPAEARQ